MLPRKQLWIAVGVLVFAAGYFVLDVRQRARMDRGVKRHRTDFTVYQAAAQALVDREDPYEARNPRGYRYVYPPLLAVLLMPVADWSPPQAALIWFLLSAAALVYALLALLRFRPVRDGPALGFGAVLLAGVTCLGFAHQGFQRGQITHVLLALHVAALISLYRGRFARAGLWLALGGALRLTPLLAAAAVGVGLLAGLRAHGTGRALRFGGGLAAGLLLGFVFVPLVALGAERARAVGGRWLDVTASVYGENEDLDAGYGINEWRFKNQAPRRVYGTWAGWATGASFERERPDLGEGPQRWVDGAASGTSWLLLAAALLAGVLFLRAPGERAYPVVFSAITLLPVLMTRYAWPTHYLLALPAVALAASMGWVRWVLLAGALLFYAAHAPALQPVGAAGCLMLACALFLAAFLGRGCAAALYPALRRRLGGLREVAALFPRRGLVVDLGCGVGALAHLLVEGGADRRVLAIDHDTQRIEGLRRSAAGLSIEARLADMAEMPLPPCAGVALVDVLHYLDREAQERLIARAAAALEPGGVLVLRDPDAAAGWRFAAARLHERVAVGLGWTQARLGAYRSGEAWADLLRAHGLKARRLPLGRTSPYADRVVVGEKP